MSEKPATPQPEPRLCAAERCGRRAAQNDVYCHRCREELTALAQWHQKQGTFERCKP